MTEVLVSIMDSFLNYGTERSQTVQKEVPVCGQTPGTCGQNCCFFGARYSFFWTVCSIETASTDLFPVVEVTAFCLFYCH